MSKLERMINRTAKKMADKIAVDKFGEGYDAAPLNTQRRITLLVDREFQSRQANAHD